MWSERLWALDADMFYYNPAFNQSLGSWNTAQVTKMTGAGHSQLRQPLALHTSSNPRPSTPDPLSRTVFSAQLM